MSSVKKNTQDIVDCLNDMLMLCENISACIDDIDYGDRKTLYDIVDENLATGDITQLKILIEYIEEFKKTKSIRSFIKFLVCFISNPYTTSEFDDKVINFIYNKLFNKGEDKNG